MRNQVLKLLPAVSLTLPSLSAQAQIVGERPEYWHYGWDSGWMVFGPLMMIAFWGGIIFLVVLAVRSFGSGPSRTTGSPAGNRPVDILQERFARGDIDKADFEERKRMLAD